jgi:hypothetical protein
MTHLLDGSGRELQELGVELRVVNAESDLGGQGEPLVSHGVGGESSRVSEGHGVGHVDHDGVSVSEGKGRGSQLASGGPRVTKGNDTVEHQLVQVARLEPEHLLDSALADVITNVLQLLVVVLESVSSLNELLSVLDQKVPNSLLGNGTDLDQLGGSVSDLSLGQGLQEAEVEVGVNGGEVGTWMITEAKRGGLRQFQVRKR